ncbi:shikimate dehydrogenase [Nesterenkonia xinjiangensis]|uniref:Shikimate dehydrogenase n=1 Tax=Nesterenkonia xinjiangensis TaxID=225327 RepID=A0A7Z0GPT3_9MICC|nr:shikimate dehydrogenase [Nesterenkonia xinjiangensis]
MRGTRAAVLGHPIGHSLSPALHGAAYRLLGVDIDYSRRDVDLSGLPRFLATEGADQDWVGWSVTMPLKAAMVSHMDTVSARVETLGVLNTVVHGPDGMHGENTDVDGIVTALGEAGLRTGATDQGRFGVIGAGSTAAAALAAAAELGFQEVRSYARSPQRAQALHPVAEALGLRLRLLPLGRLGGDLAGDELAAVVSTLPPRAADEVAPGLPRLPQNVALLDVAYDPWPSVLAGAWERAGGQVVSGLAMLLHQAVRQVERFTVGSSRPAASLSAEEHTELVARMRAALPR